MNNTDEGKRQILKQNIGTRGPQIVSGYQKLTCTLHTVGEGLLLQQIVTITLIIQIPCVLAII